MIDRGSTTDSSVGGLIADANGTREDADLQLIAEKRPDFKKISILGATGSIGDSTLDIVSRHPDKFEVVALTAGGNAEKLAKIARETNAKFVAIADENQLPKLKEMLGDLPCEIAAGEVGVVEAAEIPCDMSISAIVGFAGLRPTLAAINACSTLALANKESLVCAGELVRAKAASRGVNILPLDSEHNAIFQSLGTNDVMSIDTITLTASGGPFRIWSKSDIAKAGPKQALKHPNWSMGAKITIDSATLMNKGLEVIEAHHLFPVRYDQLEVVVHPQSIIHGMVSFIDGAVVAELGNPDMRTPIAHCMAYPQRISTPVERLDLIKLKELTFEEPDMVRFPMLAHAYTALKEGNLATNLLNAANEIAVKHFLNGEISFYGMSELVIRVIESGGRNFSNSNDIESFEVASSVDAFARKEAENIVRSMN